MSKKHKKKTRADKIAEGLGKPTQPKPEPKPQPAAVLEKKEKPGFAPRSSTVKTPTGITGDERHLDAKLGQKAKEFQAAIEAKKAAAMVATLCGADRIKQAVEERKEANEMKKNDANVFKAAGLKPKAKADKPEKPKEKGGFSFALPKIRISVERPQPTVAAAQANTAKAPAVAPKASKKTDGGKNKKKRR